MTGGLLDFFTLEASEYVEQLDGLVSRATSTPPDADAFTRAIRALRGNNTGFFALSLPTWSKVCPLAFSASWKFKGLVIVPT